MKDKALFSKANLADLECREFTIDGSETKTRGFAVKAGGQLYAYQNHCPHTGAPLNWQENKFLNINRSHIQCTLHGALFQIDDGHCIAGPCEKRYLKPVRIVVRGDIVYQESGNNAPTKLPTR